MGLTKNSVMSAVKMITTPLTAAILWAALGASAPADIQDVAGLTPADSTQLHYKIYRKGKTIGDHRVSVRLDEAHAFVDINFSIRVKFLGITAFRMDHQASERWKLLPVALEAMSATTDRSSGTFVVEVGEGEEGYDVVVNGETSEAPLQVMPTSFTLARLLFDTSDKDVVLLDTLSGILRPSRIHYRKFDEDLDVEGVLGTVNYYEITRRDTGEITHRIWYDEGDAFVQVVLTTKDGHYVEYRRQA
ncbi:MAG: DUF6134 family protein [Sphingomonadales bacterium]